MDKPMSAEEVEQVRMDAKVATNGSIMLDLIATIRARDEEIARARAKIEKLAASRSSLDCRFAGPDLCDLSGSHCPLERPCDRCSADRRIEAAERDAERFKAALGFYADPASWKWTGPKGAGACALVPPAVEIDLGKKARAALSERAP